MIQYPLLLSFHSNSKKWLCFALLSQFNTIGIFQLPVTGDYAVQSVLGSATNISAFVLPLVMVCTKTVVSTAISTNASHHGSITGCRSSASLPRSHLELYLQRQLYQQGKREVSIWRQWGRQLSHSSTLNQGSSPLWSRPWGFHRCCWVDTDVEFDWLTNPLDTPPAQRSTGYLWKKK